MTVRDKQRDVNAPRSAWPQVYDAQGRFTPQYVAYKEDLSVCHGLVAIAKMVLDRPDLRLICGNARDGILRAATDGTTIYLPQMHPNRRIATKHELAHIYFDSDIPLRLAFVEGLLGSLEKDAGRKLSRALYESLVEDMCFLINVFEDLRVNSLWGLLYPGDGRDMDIWYRGIIGPEMRAHADSVYTGGDISHLFTYAILLALGQPVTSSRWGRFQEDIETACERVLFTTFKALLLIVRDLLVGIAKEIAKESPPESQEPAWGGPARKAGEGDALTALAAMEADPKPGEEFANDNAGFTSTKKRAGSAGITAEQGEELEQLLRVDTSTGSEKILDEEEADQVRKLQELQARLEAAGPAVEEGTLIKGVKAEIRFAFVTGTDAIPVDMSVEDLATAQHWQGHFRRVLGTMKRRVSPEGYDLVPSLYISQKLSNQPLMCYRRPQAGRGFRLTLLVDLSASMNGAKFAQVERLHNVLRHALDFPFVKLDVMGFYSEAPGVVNIVKYAPNVRGLRSAKSVPKGVTPLSHAIQIAGQSMADCRHESYLFVLSDGHPVYLLKNAGSGKRRAVVDERMLRNWTADAVTALHHQCVRTYCFMIGEQTPSADAMNFMFGAQFWRKIGEDNLYQDAFEFVQERFLRFLRSR